MSEKLIALGKQISKLRNKKNLTQAELGELVGRSTNHISKLELARTNPSFELLENIAKALNIELNELFNFDNIQSPVFIRKELEKLIRSADDAKIKLYYQIFSSIDSL